jgi:O-antigen/teichoic acid export membrane protein
MAVRATLPSQLVTPSARSIRLTRTVSTTFAASATIQGLTIISGIILARTLGPGGRGELTAVLVWPAMLAAIGSIGVVESTAFFVARRDDDVGAVIGTSLGIGLAQSLVLGAIGIGVVSVVFTGSSATVTTAAYAYLAFVPLNLLSLYLMATLNGLQHFVAFNAIRILTIASTTTGIVALALSGHLGVETATVTYLLANFVAGSCAALLVAREIGVGAIRLDRAVARRLLVFGIKSHTSSVSASLNERLDQLLISIFLAPALLGLYVVAVTLTSATSLIGSSVSLVALPAIARAADEEERQRLARRFVVITALGAAAVTAPLLLLTPWLIELCFGRSFESAATVARILLVAGVFLSVNRTLAAIVKGAGRPLDAGTAEFMALGVTVVGLAVLLPMLGITGAGIASLAAYLVSTVWLLRRGARALGLQPNALRASPKVGSA